MSKTKQETGCVSSSVAPEVLTAVAAKSNTRMRNETEPGNELMKKPFLKEKEVSTLTGRAVSTLRNERHLRRGIPYLKVSERSVRYRLSDVLTFMQKRLITFNEE